MGRAGCRAVVRWAVGGCTEAAAVAAVATGVTVAKTEAGVVSYLFGGPRRLITEGVLHGRGGHAHTPQNVSCGKSGRVRVMACYGVLEEAGGGVCVAAK